MVPPLRVVSYLNNSLIQDVEDEGEVVTGLEGKRVDVLSHHICAPRICLYCAEHRRIHCVSRVDSEIEVAKTQSWRFLQVETHSVNKRNAMQENKYR